MEEPMRHRALIPFRRLAVLAAGALILGLVPAGALGGPAGGEAALDSCDWPKYGRDLGLSLSAPWECSDITPANVATLRPKWFLPAPDSVTASAAVVDGVVYVGDWDGTFYALPADGGPLASPLWTFEIDDENDVSFGRIVSSAAVAEVAGRRVVAFGGGATLYVLDAQTGEELARACTDPRRDPEPPAEPLRCRGSETDIEIESSPAIVDIDGTPHVVVGHSVHNRAGVGRTGVIAFTLDTDDWGLSARWKFDPETQRVYTSDPAFTGRDGFVVTDDPLTYGAGEGMGCGGVWGSPALDTEHGLVFFGTANCNYTGDQLPPGETGGESVWAVDLRTGAKQWMFSPRGPNTYDDDFGASPNLLPGDLVGIAGKDGVYYAFDRLGEDGEPRLVWSTRAGQPGRVQTNFSIGGMLGTPATGTVFGEPAIFATTAISTPTGRVDQGELFDPTLAEDPGRMLSLHAISAIDGRVLWRTPASRQAYGAPSFTRGIVLVPSTFDFTLKAFSADTGVLLWEHPLNGASSSTPVVVGDSVYLGAGTRTTDAEWKMFGAGAVEGTAGAHALSRTSGIWAFSLPG
jgi:outer membrane protein assembly factor BamB